MAVVEPVDDHTAYLEASGAGRCFITDAGYIIRAHVAILPITATAL